MTTPIPLYPPIRAVRTASNCFTISNGYSEVEVCRDSDLYLDGETLSSKLEELFPDDGVQEASLSVADEVYNYCNLLLRGQYSQRFAIYDCDQNRWLCLDDENEVVWTDDEFDDDIALFLSAADADDQIPDEDRESYVVQTRYLPTGD